MKEKIYRFNADTITEEDLAALEDWKKTRPQLTMGPLVKEFERRLAQSAGRKYAIVCNSGSSANLLMVDTLLQTQRLANKKVIVPSAGWPTSISPFMKLGFKPIMCEADPDNWGLDPHHLKELLEKQRPAAVMLVHVLGVPAKMDEIMELKNKYGFFLLEDACAAFGSSYHGRNVGTFGDMASISTYYGHQLPTIEGGVVFTDDKELYKKLVLLRSHGWTKDFDPETRQEVLEEYGVEDIGTDFQFLVPAYNVRQTEEHAFLGLKGLERLDWMSRRRFANHIIYKQNLGAIFQTQRYGSETTVSSIHFCALALNSQQRNKIVKNLEEEGISTRPLTAGNLGRHPFWTEKYDRFEGTMADRLYECGFFLPNHPYLNPSDIGFICDIVLKSI